MNDTMSDESTIIYFDVGFVTYSSIVREWVHRVTK